MVSLGILRRLRAWRERRRDQRRARQLWSQEMAIDAEFRRTLAELEEAGSGLVTADRCYRLARELGFRMEDLLGLPPLVDSEEWYLVRDQANLALRNSAAREEVES